MLEARPPGPGVPASLSLCGPSSPFPPSPSGCLPTLAEQCPGDVRVPCECLSLRMLSSGSQSLEPADPQGSSMRFQCWWGPPIFPHLLSSFALPIPDAHVQFFPDSGSVLKPRGKFTDEVSAVPGGSSGDLALPLSTSWSGVEGRSTFRDSPPAASVWE